MVASCDSAIGVNGGRSAEKSSGSSSDHLPLYDVGPSDTLEVVGQCIIVWRTTSVLLAGRVTANVTCGACIFYLLGGLRLVSTQVLEIVA